MQIDLTERDAELMQVIQRGRPWAAWIMALGLSVLSPATLAAAAAPSPRDNSRASQLDTVMRAAVQKFPELISGPQRAGHHTLLMLMNADGTAYHSRLSFSSLREMNAGDTAGLANIPKGQPIAGLGNAANNIFVIYSIPPVGYDASRGIERVADAVRAKHAELMEPNVPFLFAGAPRLPSSASTPATVGLLTVFMTEDGRIAHELVERKHAHEVRAMRETPPATESMAAYQLQPLPAETFRVLGLDAAQIGPSGFVLVSERPSDAPRAPGEMSKGVLVRFAWPRRPGV
jgi:hypothetical protein